MTVIATNKRAFFDYEILRTWEAGLALSGQEVKSVRDGQINLKAAYVAITGNIPWLLNAHISPYKKAAALKDYDPTRSRRLLLKKSEIKEIIGLIKQKGLTIVPLKVYTKRNLIKVEIGLTRGRKLHDKRELLKKRAIENEVRRELG